MAKRPHKRKTLPKPYPTKRSTSPATARNLSERGWPSLLAMLAVGALTAGYLLFQEDHPEGIARIGANQPEHYASEVDSGYVDPDACSGCHQDIAETYQRTGMGRSFYRPLPEKMIEDFQSDNSYYHEASDRYYTMVERNGKYYQRRFQLDSGRNETNVVEKEIHFVMGSGNHARTYLHRYADGRLVELPLGWYAEKGGFWAMNPGYDQPRHRGFRREISFDCMFCHNGYPELARGKDATGRDPLFPGHLPEGIDCQRCHGPGRNHIQAVADASPEEKIRSSIVNPAGWSAARQLELCMQCHLETTSRKLPYSVRRFDRGAFSYRPGKRLANYILHFDHAPGEGPEDKFEIAHAAYRFRKSACFQQTEGTPEALVCTSCHDPHDAPRGQKAKKHYVAVCQRCHGAAISRQRAAGKHPKGSNCLPCHMPKRRTEDVVHVVMTDHYIQRHKPTRDLLKSLEETHDTDETAYRGPVVLYYPPDAPTTPENELYLAVAQVIEGSNLEGGIPRLEKAIEKHKPSQGAFYFHLAEAYWRTGEDRKALAMYEAALARSPDHFVAQRNFGVALSRTGHLERAAEVLRKAVKDQPNDAKAFNNLGEVYLSQGKLSKAVRALRRALTLYPDMPEAHNNLASAYSRLGSAGAAVQEAKTAIRLQPDLTTAHNNLGNILATSGKLEQASRSYRQAIELDPEYAEAHYNYGNLLAGKQEFADAERQFRRALRLLPRFANAHNNLGNLLAVQGQTAEAIQHFRAALAADDRLAEAHANLATALLSQDKISEAKNHLEAAIALHPDYAEALLKLGVVLSLEGDTSNARQYLRRAAQGSRPDIQRAAQSALEELNQTLAAP